MKRWLLCGAALPLLVVVFAFARGACRYRAGSAVFMYSGYPGRSGFNLDPETRVPLRSQGCIVRWLDPLLVHVPNNAAIHLLSRAFGPMRGTYHGPYPTEDEAAGLIHGASALPAAFGAAPRSLTPGGDCQTVCNDVAGATECLGFGTTSRAGSFATLGCAIFEAETLVVGHDAAVELYARKTGSWYAHYDLPLPRELKLDGLWSGSEMKELSGGRTHSDAFSVRFAGAGGVFEIGGESALPLLEVDQSAGDQVTFSVWSRGALRRYVGRWDGRQLAGTIDREKAGAPAAKRLRFTLAPSL
jgi:hypothetical protein